MLWLYLLFLVVFPKGGFKVADVPLTWGYLLLGLTAFIIYPLRLRSIQRPSLIAISLLIPFQALIAYTLIFYGFEHVGFTLSLLISFFFLPFCAFLNPLQSQLQVFIHGLRHSLFFVAAYGIFLFILKLTTGHFFEIPYLTVNAADAGLLEQIKCIDRGGFFKLISTYNNGNIYGICILMLLPLYVKIEPSFLKRSLVRLSLLLTLSRTVWIGLLFLELLTPRYRAVKLTCALVAIGVIGWIFPFSSDFFFDFSLGGRLDSLELENLTLWPSQPFEGIGEITYIWILKSFGALGLAAFCLGMGSPFLLVGSQENSPLYQKELLKGLACYWVISFSDGALLYIPTLCFYWMLSAFALGKDPKPSCIS